MGGLINSTKIPLAEHGTEAVGVFKRLERGNRTNLAVMGTVVGAIERGVGTGVRGCVERGVGTGVMSSNCGGCAEQRGNLGTL